MQLGRYTAILLLTCAAFYGLTLGTSYLLFPDRSGSQIDTEQAKQSLFGTEPKYLVFSLARLNHGGTRVIFIGASNVREGFRPPLFKGPLADVEVDNLAIGSAEIRETQEIVDAVYARTPQSSWHEITFVIGLWYGMFQPDRLAWPGRFTDFDSELLRYGIYARSGGELHRRMPVSLEPIVETGLRPMLLVSRSYDLYIAPLVTDVRVFLLRMAGENPADVTIADRNLFVLSPNEKTASLAAWYQRMGPVESWDSRSFAGLYDLAQRISGHGSHLVMLDLPLPRWHREGVPYDMEYQRRSAGMIERASSLPGVTYASMRDGFQDDQFYDSAHPRPRFTPLWAQRAVPAIRSAISGSKR